jgi:hypothetical protein
MVIDFLKKKAENMTKFSKNLEDNFIIFFLEMWRFLFIYLNLENLGNFSLNHVCFGTLLF